MITIAILTRLYVKKESDEDEFFNYLENPVNDNYHLENLDNIQVIILHGHDKRFLSRDPSLELDASIQEIIKDSKIFLFYHSGNEEIIPQLPHFQKSIPLTNVAATLPYSLDGGGPAGDRGSIISGLYHSINQVNHSAINNHVSCQLEMFEQKKTNKDHFLLIDSLYNLPYTNNLNEVVNMTISEPKLIGFKINKIPLISYMKSYQKDTYLMQELAKMVKKYLIP
jgi:hypothetical protein